MNFIQKLGKVFSGGLDDLAKAPVKNDKVDVDLGRGRYRGNSGNFGTIARDGLVIVAIIGMGIAIYKGIKGIFNYWKDRKKAKEEICRINAKADAKIKVINTKADADIRVAEAKAAGEPEPEVKEHEDANLQSDDDATLEHEKDEFWLDEFIATHPFPIDALPDDFATVIGGYGPDIAPAMFFHLNSMYGAICFSRVFVKKKSDEIRRANLQVVIEALPGIGKSMFRNVYTMLFQRVIDEDKMKKNDNTGKKHIIQTVGIDISSARLQEIMRANQGVHVYTFDSEIATVTNKELSVFLRKSFDNDDVDRGRMGKKNGQKGSCEALINGTFTGSTENVEEFVKKIATVEGGGASRICWGLLLLLGDYDNAPFSLEDGPELERMRDHIDEYRRKYVFTTADGEDTAVGLFEIKDFDYVKAALNSWEARQVDLSKRTHDPARNQCRFRISNIAMHVGIVMHMMIQPNGNSVKMGSVVKLVLYAADYCMERYLMEFGERHNAMIRKFVDKERVKKPGQTQHQSPTANNNEMANRRANVIRLHYQGLNPHQIAEELDLYDPQVHRILKQAGLIRKKR